MAVIGIDYNEGDIELGYKSVYLHTTKEKYIFDSGDFIKDWFLAKKKYIDISNEEPHFSQSSSVDHFIMDGAKYESAFLHSIEDQFTLLYFENHDIEDYEYELKNSYIYKDGWEFFVNEGTKPTWEELKEYCLK